MGVLVCRGEFSAAKADLVGYRTVTYSRVHSPVIGITYRLAQLAIFIYICVYVRSPHLSVCLRRHHRRASSPPLSLEKLPNRSQEPVR